MRCWLALMLLTSFSVAVFATDKKSSAENSVTTASDSLISRLRIKDGWLANDKAAHFAGSAFITAGGFYFLRQEQDVDRDKSLLLSGSVALVIGIGKEIYDRRRPQHVASWKDVVADVAGIGVALLILRR